MSQKFLRLSVLSCAAVVEVVHRIGLVSDAAASVCPAVQVLIIIPRGIE